MKYTIVSRENDEKLVEADRVGGGLWKFSGRCGDVSLSDVEVGIGADGAEVTVGAECEIFPSVGGVTRGEVHIATALGSMSLLVLRGAAEDSAGAGAAANKPVKSSMPGKVLSVACKVGDHIEAGQTILVIEAMKMENEIRSAGAGIVEKIAVTAGQKVEAGELLLVLGKQE